jgi:hypothetical protein
MPPPHQPQSMGSFSPTGIQQFPPSMPISLPMSPMGGFHHGNRKMTLVGAELASPTGYPAGMPMSPARGSPGNLLIPISPQVGSCRHSSPPRPNSSFCLLCSYTQPVRHEWSVHPSFFGVHARLLIETHCCVCARAHEQGGNVPVVQGGTVRALDENHVLLPTGDIVTLPPGGEGIVTMPTGEVRSTPAARWRVCFFSILSLSLRFALLSSAPLVSSRAAACLYAKCACFRVRACVRVPSLLFGVFFPCAKAGF